MHRPFSRRLRAHPPGIGRYQGQAVLRRVTRTSPLRLVGITLDAKFYPRALEHATGTLVLTKGLVALSPLSAVDAEGPDAAATIAMAEADEDWDGDNSPGGDSGDLP
jgi:hypothetical protein